MLTCQKDKFNLAPEKTYLNCAYMSPLLKSVEEAGITGIRKKRNPFEVSPEDFFADTEKVRDEFAKIINSDQPDRIVLIPSVSYGLANVAKNIDLKAGEEIMLAGEQFPSNYYPWKRLCDECGGTLTTIKPPNTLEGRGSLWNEQILEAIDSNTRVVALGHVHWADGTLFDLEKIRQKTSEVGALLIIDGTQSVGALPFDVQKIKPDALICAGYKWLLGPYSIGLAYYGEAFDNGSPIEENWINRLHSEDFSGLINYEDNYQAGSLRYEVGEHSNFILVPMLLAALRQLNAWGVEHIQAYCEQIITRALNELKHVQIEEEAFRGSHLFGIRIPSGDMEKIKQTLAAAEISVSVRGDAIRVSPNVYNTEVEMLKLVEAVNSCI